MLLYKDLLYTLDQTTSKVLSTVTEEQFRQVVQIILGTERIFIHGAGRSGLAGRFLGMRLMHTGKTVHIIGDTVTPTFLERDLLLIITGSGDTLSVLHIAEKGKAAGGKVLVITGKNPIPAKHPLAALPHLVIQLQVPQTSSKKTEVALFPLGTLFEICALLFLETVVAGIVDTLQIKQETLQSRHANLE